LPVLPDWRLRPLFILPLCVPAPAFRFRVTAPLSFPHPRRRIHILPRRPLVHLVEQLPQQPVATAIPGMLLFRESENLFVQSCVADLRFLTFRYSGLRLNRPAHELTGPRFRLLESGMARYTTGQRVKRIGEPHSAGPQIGTIVALGSEAFSTAVLYQVRWDKNPVAESLIAESELIDATGQ
jgi:hypothetical protein